MNASEAADIAHIEGYVGLPQRTVIVRAVLSNRVEAHLTATSLLSAIDLKIETLRASGSNSDIDEISNLKLRVEEFLTANANRDETPIVDSTLSIAEGLRLFWTERHISICEKNARHDAFQRRSCFLRGVTGVLTVPIALTVGALVGGKSVVETLKAAAKLLPGREDSEA
jgi:hypothetical protein